MAKAVKRVRVTAQHVAKARSDIKKDQTPQWAECESWSAAQFASAFREAMNYYSNTYSGKDLKPAVVKWMHLIGATVDDISAFKRTKDWRSSPTMGAIASCILNGMPSQRDDFNNGRDCAKWLLEQVSKTINDGANDSQSADDSDLDQPKQPITIQMRVKDAASWIARDIDLILEEFYSNPAEFSFASIQAINILKSKGARAAHARLIKDMYSPLLNELLELASGNADEQLREGYLSYSKRQIRALIAFLQSIHSACDTIIEQTKVVRKPVVKKAVPKSQLVATLRYKRADDVLKLVSIDPVSIIGAKELWTYNTRLKKIAKYTAQENMKLSVKGLSIVNFDLELSRQKTLKSPSEQLATFKSMSRALQSKFLETITTVDTKVSSRLSEDTILLKVSS